MPEAIKLEWFKTLTSDELAALNYDWTFWGRDDQQPPARRLEYLDCLSRSRLGKSPHRAEFVRFLSIADMAALPLWRKPPLMRATSWLRAKAEFLQLRPLESPALRTFQTALDMAERGKGNNLFR